MGQVASLVIVPAIVAIVVPILKSAVTVAIEKIVQHFTQQEPNPNPVLETIRAHAQQQAKRS